MARRNLPEVSAGSMADIAFLLLIFFLVTTTMEREAGVMRLLPELNQPDPQEVNKRNVIVLLVNNSNQILLQDELIEMEDVSAALAPIILNETNKENWPVNLDVERSELEANLLKAQEELSKDPKKKTYLKKVATAELRLKTYDTFGSMFKKSKHVVSIQSTRGAEYNTNIELNDQVLKAYRILQNNAAKKKWGVEYNMLNDERKAMLKLLYPEKISEAPTVKGKL